jgi:hypothetical protein
MIYGFGEKQTKPGDLLIRPHWRESREKSALAWQFQVGNVFERQFLRHGSAQSMFGTLNSFGHMQLLKDIENDFTIAAFSGSHGADSIIMQASFLIVPSIDSHWQTSRLSPTALLESTLPTADIIRWRLCRSRGLTFALHNREADGGWGFGVVYEAVGNVTGKKVRKVLSRGLSSPVISTYR